MAVKKGDRVRVVKNEHGDEGPPYGVGATGTVENFRNNRFFGRQAVVRVDDYDPLENGEPLYADWSLTDTEVI